MAEAVANNSSHRVFISDKASYVRPGEHPNATITHGCLGQGDRLAAYDLVILDFTEFSSKAASGAMDQFAKQALEALEKGTTLCFVHYDDSAPDFRFHGYSNQSQVVTALRQQVGFRLLYGKKIRIGRAPFPLLDGKVHRAEFSEFLKKWGASHNFFEKFGDGAFDEILYSHKDKALGFTEHRDRGAVIYLPFQRNSLNHKDQRLATEKLIDALLTYLSKRHRNFPDWAQAPFFGDEVDLQREKAKLEESLKAKDADLSVFVRAKSLLLANEGDLELAVPKFLREHLSMQTLRDETFNEDFWLLDAKSSKTAICEVKSVTKGFKKGAIYDVYNHRETRGCDEAFPAILFVNANLQAANWEKKDVAIATSDQKIAFDNNVLVVRIEDLVRLWNGIRKGVFSAQDVQRLLHGSRGWLEVTSALKTNIRTGS